MSIPSSPRPGDLRLAAAVTAAVRAQLPVVAEQTVAAVVLEVPEYADALTGTMGANIENAVRLALGGFLNLASQAADTDASAPLRPALDGAYALGRGEARSGRSMNALLGAYRVGARVSWRGLARAAVDSGLDAPSLVGFAELVFAYIDQLSAASVAGHSDELATTGRVRQRYLELLARALLDVTPDDALALGAERADWPPPQTLTAVLLPRATFRDVPTGLPPQTLRLEDDATEPGASGAVVLLVPDVDGPARARLLRLLSGRRAVVGPARGWMQVRLSHRRAVRAATVVPDAGEPIDTEQHLSALVLGSDPEALADLRSQVLAPLSALRTDAAEKLRQTLQSWLLHQGRREEVAAELFVHPQTVRYRMGQLREIYGDQLDDPVMILKLTIALAAPL